MKKTYLKQLDGLRAFAVIFTMITHFTLSREGPLALVPWGWMGVRLFFRPQRISNLKRHFEYDRPRAKGFAAHPEAPIPSEPLQDASVS